VHGSRHIQLPRADGDDLSLVGVLGRIGGQDDAADGGGLLGRALDQNAIGEGLKFLEDGLRSFDPVVVGFSIQFC